MEEMEKKDQTINEPLETNSEESLLVEPSNPDPNAINVEPNPEPSGTSLNEPNEVEKKGESLNG
ncbi:MAG: hypothetical protein RH862_20195 [Leptospiraceae bacterium]